MPVVERPAFSTAEIEKIITGLNHIDRFPVPLSVLEEHSGVVLGEHLEVGRFMHAHTAHRSITLTATLFYQPEGEQPRPNDPLIESVEIIGEGVDLDCPPPARDAIRFDVGTYTYLPTTEWVDPVGDGQYRHLRCEGRREGDESSIRKWTYWVDNERGPYLAASEIRGLQRVILGLLQAIREDRFVAHYEAFLQDFPTNEDGAHELYGHTLRIMQFDDRDEKYQSDHLAKEGLKAYVGIHVYNERASTARYPHPYLFDFFGVETLDATQFYRGAPYNPVDNDMPGSHPMADLKNPLPDISAAGHREGGLAHYGSLEVRTEGWTFECPGAYPHDGRSVATMLDPEILQFGGFTVTHSRRK